MTPSREDRESPESQVYVGIDAGSVSVNSIVIDAHQRIIHESPYQRHFGQVLEQFGEVEQVVAVLGHCGRDG